jgi:hypothetical protein
MRCGAAALFLAALASGSSDGAAQRKAPGGGGAALPTPSAGLSDELPERLVVPLRELRARRAALLGQEVELVIQVRAERPAWNPYHSRFTPARWACFSAWADEAFLWEREAYEDPAPWLFAPRDGAVHRLLSTARPYERFRVVARVREVFLDEPWIELRSAERLAPCVTEGTLLEAERGLAFLEKGAARLAREAFERASAGNLPDHVRAELARLARQAALRLPPDDVGP